MLNQTLIIFTQYLHFKHYIFFVVKDASKEKAESE